MDNFFKFQEFKEKNLWKSLVAEFIGTAFLVLIGCGSVTGASTDTVDIALCFGLMVTVIVQTLGHISGGHVNPAITAGMLTTGNCSLPRAILYLIVQCLGSIAGAAVLYAILPDDMRGQLGATNLGSNVSELKGVFIEVLITFTLVITVFSVADPNRKESVSVAPLTIGLAVIASHLFALGYTGSSMNSARSLGPAVVTNNWKNHWVYWVGPNVGGIVGALLYKYVLSAEGPEERSHRVLEKNLRR